MKGRKAEPGDRVILVLGNFPFCSGENPTSIPKLTISISVLLQSRCIATNVQGWKKGRNRMSKINDIAKDKRR